MTHNPDLFSTLDKMTSQIIVCSEFTEFNIECQQDLEFSLRNLESERNEFTKEYLNPGFLMRA